MPKYSDTNVWNAYSLILFAIATNLPKQMFCVHTADAFWPENTVKNFFKKYYNEVKKEYEL